MVVGVVSTSGSFDSSGPYPDLLPARWRSEANPERAVDPGSSVGLRQFLDAVLPDDPGVHSLPDSRVQTSSCPSCSDCRLRAVAAQCCGAYKPSRQPPSEARAHALSPSCGVRCPRVSRSAAADISAGSSSQATNGPTCPTARIGCPTWRMDVASRLRYSSRAGKTGGMFSAAA